MLLGDGNYPETAPEVTGDLPQAVNLQWTVDSRLIHIIQQYETAIDKYQDFWNLLEDLDKHTWILEPEKPLRSHTMRRIGIGNHSSLQIEVDPLNPRGVPEIRFLGADSIVVPLREKLNKGTLKWDMKDTLRNNLQKVLEMEFPKPNVALKEEFSVACGVCYAYRLNNKIPDKVCDNPKVLRIIPKINLVSVVCLFIVLVWWNGYGLYHLLDNHLIRML